MSPYSFTQAGTTYDAEDWLTGFARAATSGTPQLSQSWNLFAVGDWNSVTTNGTAQSRTHGPTHELLTAGGQGVTHQYDALGRRVARTASNATTVFVQVDQQTICDYVSGAAPASSTYRYLYASYIDEPIVRVTTSNSETTWYHRNQQYSIVACTDSTGAATERYAYTAYGLPTITDGSGTVRTSSAIANRYTYTGREWDGVLGLYHYRARMYEATVGRFCSRDPIGYFAFPNIYCYTHCGPTVHIDPSGLLEYRTEFWWERHHWFPLSRRVAIESLCSNIGFNVDAFVTPLLAAKDVPVLSPLEILLGIEPPSGSMNGIYNDHYWLHHGRIPKWEDIVDRNLKSGDCCKFLTAMIPEILRAYQDIRQRHHDRSNRVNIYPPTIPMTPYTGPFSHRYPDRIWFFDELGEAYDYRGIDTFNLLNAARVAACAKDKQKFHCDQWVREKRKVTDIYGGGLIDDGFVETLALPIKIPVLKAIPKSKPPIRIPANRPTVRPFKSTPPGNLDVPLHTAA